MVNRIEDGALRAVRDDLHDWMLEEMNRIRDPYRSWMWGNRSWRSVRGRFYHGGTNRKRPKGFDFQPTSIDS
jgi:hypothetical protein